jgi:hypothetical protein
MSCHLHKCFVIIQKIGLKRGLLPSSLLLANLFIADRLLGMEYHLRALAGIYRSSETFKAPVDGSEKNDSQAALGSLYLDVKKILSSENRFTLEVRDRYDSFGNIDQEQTRLVTSTEPEVRQLVFRVPNSNGRFYGSIGRFPILDAATIANDGVEGGMRFSPQFSLGVFGGLYPERKDGNTVLLSQEGTQSGVYVDYDDRSKSDETHIYFASALVSRQSKDKNPDDDIPSRKTAATAISYNNIVYQPQKNLRLTLLTLLDVAPKARAKNFYSSYMQRINQQLVANLYLLRIDPTEYEKLRDLRDTLAPSVLTQAHFLLKQALTRKLSLWYDASYGLRSQDKLTRQQYGLRLIVSRLGGTPLGTHIGAWIRKNYESDDTVFKGGLNYTTEKFDVSVVQRMITENRKNGTTSRPLITDITGGLFFNKEIMGTLGFEYAVDEKVTIVSGLIGIGLRMTSEQTTPAGSTPTPPESL